MTKWVSRCSQPCKEWHFTQHVRPDSCHDHHEVHVLPLWRLRGPRRAKDRMSSQDLTQMMIELSVQTSSPPPIICAHFMKQVFMLPLWPLYSTQSLHCLKSITVKIFYTMKFQSSYINYVVHFYKLSLEWRASWKKSNLLIPANLWTFS